MNTPYETEIRGERVIVTVANPAAGANWTYTLLAGYNWEPVSMIFRLLTSAVVLTRFWGFTISDGANVHYRAPDNVVSNTAGTSKRVTFYGNAANLTGSNYGTLNAPFSPSWILPPGSVFTSAINPIDAGDQISEIVMYFRRWLPR